MDQETQQQPQENSPKKPPSGWRHYSPTDRSSWPPTGRQVLTTIGIVALVSLSLIGYFLEWWPVFLIAAILLIVIGYRKAKRLPTRVWKALKGNTALAGVLAALLAAVIGLGGVLYQQRVAFELADQERQETQVQTYFDDIGGLLLDTDRPLREARLGSDVSVLAQAKTLAVL